MPGGNIGENVAIFEQVSRRGRPWSSQICCAHHTLPACPPLVETDVAENHMSCLASRRIALTACRMLDGTHTWNVSGNTCLGCVGKRGLEQ